MNNEFKGIATCRVKASRLHDKIFKVCMEGAGSLI